MARFKVTPIYVSTGAEAPSFIADLDDNKDVQNQADNLCYLVRRFPRNWVTSSTKLNPCKVDMQRGR
jgi:hypothetical protein